MNFSFAKDFGIREKMLIIFLLIGAAFGLAVTWYAQQLMGHFLSDYHQNQGIYLAESIAAQSEDPLISGDRYQLFRIIERTMERHPGLTYVFFLDASQEEVLVDSFESETPDEIVQLNQAASENNSIQSFDADNETIYDIAVPVQDGNAGVVRIGLSTSEIASLINHLKNSLWLGTVGMLLGGMFGMYLFSRTIVQPIHHVTQGAEKAINGQLVEPPKSNPRHEIQQLQNAIYKLTHSTRQLHLDKETYKNQAEQSERLRKKLLSKTIKAQEEERKRIARELHDETGQSLTTLKLALKQIETCNNLEEVRQMTQQLRSLTGNVIDEVKGIARDLRPSVLDDLGLEYALKKYLQDVEKHSGIHTEFYVVTEKEAHPDSDGATNIYRIVQESVNNAVKHAEANKIEVIFYKKSSGFSVVVEDDGKGFDQSKMERMETGKVKASESGLGLFSMKERAALIGGKLTIDSEPGEGTRIYFHIKTRGRDQERG